MFSENSRLFFRTLLLVVFLHLISQQIFFSFWRGKSWYKKFFDVDTHSSNISFMKVKFLEQVCSGFVRESYISIEYIGLN